MLGPFQLAQPERTRAQAAIASAQRDDRHFLREVIQGPSIFAAAKGVPAAERRRTVKLYRLEWGHDAVWRRRRLSFLNIWGGL
jgi:hypothetical protein